MRESDSHENLHPRVCGSRFFICIKPTRIERKCVPHIFSFTFQFPKVRVCCSADVGPAQFHRVLFSRRHWNVSGLNNFIVSPKNCSKSTDVIGDLHNWELVGLTKEKTESTILCKDSSIAYPETKTRNR